MSSPALGVPLTKWWATFIASHVVLTADHSRKKVVRALVSTCLLLVSGTTIAVQRRCWERVMYAVGESGGHQHAIHQSMYVLDGKLKKPILRDVSSVAAHKLRCVIQKLCKQIASAIFWPLPRKILFSSSTRSIQSLP